MMNLAGVTAKATRFVPWWLNPHTILAAILIGLLAYIGLQKIELLTCRLHLMDYKHQIERISDKRNEQQRETVKNIAKAKDRIIYVDRKAREIEGAPLPGNCKTPDAILRSADL